MANELTPPPWTTPLIQTIESFWKSQGHGQQIRTTVSFNDEQQIWRLFVSPKLHEIVGGAKDGETYWTPFVFEAGDFCDLPEVEIENFAVASRCGNSALREPRMMLVGKYRGNRIFIEILLEPSTAEEIPF